MGYSLYYTARELLIAKATYLQVLGAAEAQEVEQPGCLSILLEQNSLNTVASAESVWMREVGKRTSNVALVHIALEGVLLNSPSNAMDQSYV